MAVIIIFSGADGTGKSTIIESYKKKLIDGNYTVSIIWLRFVSYFSKIINMFGRLLGLSYVEHHKWGKVGYHDYKGLIGYFYILATYVDQRLYLYKFLYFHKSAGVKSDYYLYDRYLVDAIADLMVDTDKNKFILFLFSGMIKKLQSHVKLCVLSCPPPIVISRRPDIKDDKKYYSRVKSFNRLIRFFQLQRINTGSSTVEEVIDRIVI